MCPNDKTQSEGSKQGFGLIRDAALAAFTVCVRRVTDYLDYVPTRDLSRSGSTTAAGISPTTDSDRILCTAMTLYACVGC